MNTFFFSTDFYALSAAINCAASMGIGLFILIQNPRASLNRSFFYFASAVAVWSVGYALWQLSTDAVDALLWARLLMVGAIFTAPTYLHFVFSLIGTQHRKRSFLFLFYALSLVFVFFDLTPTLSPLFIDGVKNILFFPFWPKAGPLYAYYLLMWLICNCFVTYLLVVGYRNSSDIVLRRQIIFVFIAMVIASVSGSTNYFLWYGIPIPPYANIFVMLYVLVIGYAVMRHHLFNFKAISAELATFALLAVLLFRTVFSTPSDRVVNASILTLSIIGGFFLVRSIIKEEQQRELIERQKKELEQTNANLELANQNQENLIHFITHEVKGYFTKSQVGFAAIADESYGHVSDALKSLATRERDEMQQGVDMVSDILGAANFKKGVVSYSMRPFDLVKVAHEVYAEFEPAAKEKRLMYSFAAPRVGECIVMGDKVQMAKHVLYNLVDNAVKYTPAGSVSVAITMQGGVARFAVSDTGVGITPEDNKKLFTEGGRGKDSLAINAHSTGYGLYIAKSIVGAHHGTIRVSSTPGKGSTFTVDLQRVGDAAIAGVGTES